MRPLVTERNRTGIQFVCVATVVKVSGGQREKPAAMRYTRNIIAQIRPYGFARVRTAARQYGRMNIYLSTFVGYAITGDHKAEYVRERIELAARLLNSSRRKVEEAERITR